MKQHRPEISMISQTDKVVIADIGVEGGGVTIYGSQLTGVWTFWTEGTSMDLHENDGEEWRSWSSKPVNSLDPVLPKEWPTFYPRKFHPGFVCWFRANYNHVRAQLPEDQRRYQNKHRRLHWMEILGMPGKGGVSND
jgi:hypothetical protein